MIHHILKSIARFVSIILFVSCFGIADAQQTSQDHRLEKMPVDLETDFALSSLPPYIRDKATVYLLDPANGYYIGRQGSNGFVSFVLRTEWDRADFRNDIATPVSYDAEGAKVIFPMYIDVEMMRASGKYTPVQLKDTIAARFKSGYYKAPKAGLSYMIAPIMRNYDGPSSTVKTMSIPHYMFYAPYISAADIGGNSPNGGPIVIGNDRSPHEYVIFPVGEKEKEEIMKEHKELLRRLTEYRSYFQYGGGGKHH